MSVQQPQATYQQQPGPGYGQPQGAPQPGYGEKGGPPPQGYQQQPAPQQGMNPNVPGGGAHQFDANGEREWSYGLLDCFSDCGTCCLAYFCPCVVFQQVKQRINYLSSNGRPDPEQGGSGCGGDCCLYGTVQACVGLGCLFQIGTRSSIRARYRIRGSGFTDCLASCFCVPCELTQSSRELEVEEATMR
jgi:Cys-rich protein (TIGR01571 family)